jgi:hypothetical protein
MMKSQNDCIVALWAFGLSVMVWSCGGGGGGSSSVVTNVAPQFAASTYSQSLVWARAPQSLVGFELERDLWAGGGKAVYVEGSLWTVFGAGGQVECVYDKDDLNSLGVVNSEAGDFYDDYVSVNGGFLAFASEGKLVAFNPSRKSQIVRDLPKSLFYGGLRADLSGNAYLAGGRQIRSIDASGQTSWSFVVNGDYCKFDQGQDSVLVEAKDFLGDFEPPFETRLASVRSNGQVSWQKTFSGNDKLGLDSYSSDVPDFMSIGNGMYIGSYGSNVFRYKEDGRHGIFILRANGTLGLFQAQLGGDALRAEMSVDSAGALVAGRLDLFASTVGSDSGGQFGYLLHVSPSGTQLRATALMFEGEADVRLTSARIETQTGDQVAAALTNGGVHVFRARTGGDIGWSKALVQDGQALTGRVEVVGLANGGALLALKPSGQFLTPWYLAAIGADGQTLWSKRIDDPQSNGWNEAQAISLSDGSWCLRFYNDSGSTQRQLLTVVDPSGGIRWMKLVENGNVYSAAYGGISLLSKNYANQAVTYQSWSFDADGNTNAPCLSLPYLAVNVPDFLQPSRLSTMSVSLASMPNVFDEQTEPIGAMSSDFLLPEGAAWQSTQVDLGALCKD